MKKREGWVSNSSSSSFLLFGTLVSPKSITEPIFKDNEVFVLSHLYGSEGQIGFNVDWDDFLKIQSHGLDNSTYIENIMVYPKDRREECRFSDDGEGKVPAGLPDFICEELDYHGDVEYFIERNS